MRIIIAQPVDKYGFKVAVFHKIKHFGVVRHCCTHQRTVGTLITQVQIWFCYDVFPDTYTQRTVSAFIMIVLANVYSQFI